jgi:hypothetical protein
MADLDSKAISIPDSKTAANPVDVWRGPVNWRLYWIRNDPHATDEKRYNESVKTIEASSEIHLKEESSALWMSNLDLDYMKLFIGRVRNVHSLGIQIREVSPADDGYDEDDRPLELEMKYRMLQYSHNEFLSLLYQLLIQIEGRHLAFLRVSVHNSSAKEVKDALDVMSACNFKVRNLELRSPPKMATLWKPLLLHWSEAIEVIKSDIWCPFAREELLRFSKLKTFHFRNLDPTCYDILQLPELRSIGLYAKVMTWDDMDKIFSTVNPFFEIKLYNFGNCAWSFCPQLALVVRASPCLSAVHLHVSTESDISHLAAMLPLCPTLRNLVILPHPKNDIKLPDSLQTNLLSHPGLTSLVIMGGSRQLFWPLVLPLITKTRPTSLASFRCSLANTHLILSEDRAQVMNAVQNNTTLNYLDFTCSGKHAEDQRIPLYLDPGWVSVFKINKNITNFGDPRHPQSAPVQKLISANGQRRENWIRICILLRFIRTNRDHAFRYSVLPLLSHIAGLTTARKKSGGVQSIINFDRFIDCKYARSCSNN